MEKEFIGRRISKLRNAKQISARKLSIDLGQSENYITKIENGQNNITMEGLFNICDYFKISLSDFFDDKTEYPLQYRKILDELNKLDSIELEKVYDMIKLVTDNKKKI